MRNRGKRTVLGLTILLLAGAGLQCTNSDVLSPAPGQLKLSVQVSPAGSSKYELGSERGHAHCRAESRYIRREEVSEQVIEGEKSIYREQAKQSGKPEKFWDKIISGRLEKFYAEVCLLEQTYIKDDTRTVQEVLNELIAKLGENISIRRFVRYQLGETLSR